MPRSTDRDYKARLGEVLRRRDPAALHLFLRQSAAGYGDNGQVQDVEERSHQEMEELMHRMIMARPDLADVHAASRSWLAARGLTTGSARSAGSNGSAGGPRKGRRRAGPRPEGRSNA